MQYVLVLICGFLKIGVVNDAFWCEYYVYTFIRVINVTHLLLSLSSCHSLDYFSWELLVNCIPLTHFSDDQDNNRLSHVSNAAEQPHHNIPYTRLFSNTQRCVCNAWISKIYVGWTENRNMHIHFNNNIHAEYIYNAYIYIYAYRGQLL